MNGLQLSSLLQGTSVSISKILAEAEKSFSGYTKLIHQFKMCLYANSFTWCIYHLQRNLMNSSQPNLGCWGNPLVVIAVCLNGVHSNWTYSSNNLYSLLHLGLIVNQGMNWKQVGPNIFQKVALGMQLKNFLQLRFIHCHICQIIFALKSKVLKWQI